MAALLPFITSGLCITFGLATIADMSCSSVSEVSLRLLSLYSASPDLISSLGPTPKYPRTCFSSVSEGGEVRYSTISGVMPFSSSRARVCLDFEQRGL